MTRRTLSLFLVAAFLAPLGCQSAASPVSPEVSVPTAAGAAPLVLTTAISSAPVLRPAPPSPDLRMIVLADKARDFYWRATPATKFFTPSDAEIATLDAKLPGFLRTNAPPSRFGEPPLAERAPKYMRQYVGHIDPNGRRWIWANFFCRYYGVVGDADGWKTHSFAVKDGGDCYFNVEFSLDTGEWKELSVNGDG